MKAGALSHRIALQRATEARNSFGDPIQTWANVAQVWASVEWASGSESFDADRERVEVPVSIQVRRSTDTMTIREKDRALVPTMAATTLRDTIGSSTTTVMVLEDPGVCPPDADFVMRIGSELVQVTAGAGTVSSPYTITRGAYGTTAARHQYRATAHVLVELEVDSVTLDRYGVQMTASRSEFRP